MSCNNECLNFFDTVSFNLFFKFDSNVEKLLGMLTSPSFVAMTTLIPSFEIMAPVFILCS